MVAFSSRAFFYPWPRFEPPLANGFLISLSGTRFGILAAETQRMEQTPHMIRMIGHPEGTLDDLGYPQTRPQGGIIPGGLRTGYQDMGQLLFLRRVETTTTAWMRFGLKPFFAIGLFRRFPARNRRRRSLDQTGYFIDAFSFVEQLGGQLTTVFEPIGTSFRSHGDKYKSFH